MESEWHEYGQIDAKFFLAPIRSESSCPIFVCWGNMPSAPSTGANKKCHGFVLAPILHRECFGMLQEQLSTMSAITFAIDTSEVTDCSCLGCGIKFF